MSPVQGKIFYVGTYINPFSGKNKNLVRRGQLRPRPFIFSFISEKNINGEVWDRVLDIPTAFNPYYPYMDILLLT